MRGAGDFLGGPMVQVRNTVEVEYGHFSDVLRCYEELNEISRAHGWQPATFYVRTGSKVNVLCASTEYDSMGDWQREQQGAFSDPQFMKVIREAAQYCVQG